MKTIIAILAALLVWVSGGFAADTFAQSEIALSITDATTGQADASGPPDGQVTMRVRAEGTETMQGLQFKVIYDSSVLGIVTTTKGALPQDFLFQKNTATAGEVSIALVGDAAAGVGGFDVADIVFELVGNPGATSPLTFAGALAGDSSIPTQPIQVTTVPGSISIEGTPPRDIRITNVTDVAFAVTWITDSPADGKVDWGLSAALGNIAEDERGGATVDHTHSVVISGLTPNITYFFDVISGGVLDDNNGNHYQVTTGPTLGPPSTDSAFGKVVLEDGVTLAEGCLVYVRVVDVDGQGSAGQSQLLSALVEPSGFWAISIGAARVEALNAFFLYGLNGEDRVAVEAQCGPVDGVGSLIVDTGNDSPTPVLVVSPIKCHVYELVQGLNFVTLAIDPAQSFTASTLAQEIVTQGGSVLHVYRWRQDLGTWEDHPVGFPFNDFAIELARAYFVWLAQASNVELCGAPITAPVPVELVNGLNGLGFPLTSQAFTASSLAQAIAQQGGSTVHVYRWREDLGTWEDHPVGFPFNDFPIEEWRGYMLSATQASTFSP